MQIEIKRKRTTRYGTDGHLYIDGTYVCDTAENPINHLPAGDYEVQLQYDATLGRKVPLLISDYHVAIIAYGNGLCNARDCRIHVGEHRVSGLVIHSHDTFHNLYDRINNSMRRGHKVQVVIR